MKNRKSRGTVPLSIEVNIHNFIFALGNKLYFGLVWIALPDLLQVHRSLGCSSPIFPGVPVLHNKK
jgi:hypothetical protein